MRSWGVGLTGVVAALALSACGGDEGDGDAAAVASAAPVEATVTATATPQTTSPDVAPSATASVTATATATAPPAETPDAAGAPTVVGPDGEVGTPVPTPTAARAPEGDAVRCLQAAGVRRAREAEDLAFAAGFLEGGISGTTPAGEGVYSVLGSADDGEYRLYAVTARAGEEFSDAEMRERPRRYKFVGYARDADTFAPADACLGG
jgi:hypothetical protein